MKILLAQRTPCFPAIHGDTKFNQGLLEALAQRNHSCRMVALASTTEGPEDRRQLRRTLTAQGIASIHSSSDADVYVRRGVEIHIVADGYHLWTRLADQIRQFEPTCVLISEDRTFLGLATALEEAGPERVVYKAESQSTLPFGPECFFPDATKTEMLKQAARIVTPSRYLRDYIRRWSGLEADVLLFPAYGAGPFPNFGRPDAGFVTLVNPSQIKGVCIFEELARARPNVAFAAVPTWATTNADLERLQRLRNVRLLPPADDIDEVFARTRVLLAPSLWGESFGRIVVEAMLRGIPVLASNIGGLPEAKLGIDYLLPVRPIERYLERADERRLPIPIVPAQDVGPWLGALDGLLSDPGLYRHVSAASRFAALNYVSSLEIASCEELLGRLETALPGGFPRRQNSARQGSGIAECLEAPSNLSRERRELLAALLRDNPR